MPYYSRRRTRILADAYHIDLQGVALGPATHSSFDYIASHGNGKILMGGHLVVQQFDTLMEHHVSLVVNCTENLKPPTWERCVALPQWMRFHIGEMVSF